MMSGPPRLYETPTELGLRINRLQDQVEQLATTVADLVAQMEQLQRHYHHLDGSFNTTAGPTL